MSREIRIPKELGDKLSAKFGLAPGGLKRIRFRVDTEADEPSPEEIARALTAEGAEVEVLKHFEFASLGCLAEDLLDTYDEDSAEGASHPPTHVVMVQAASLECFLNDVLIHHARVEYGEDAQHLGPAFISGSFRSKLYRVVPTLSKGTKILDSVSEVARRLEDLISTRNRVTHTTEYYSSPADSPKKKRRRLKPVTQAVTKRRCQRFQLALRDFTSAVWNAPPWDAEFFKDPEPETKDV